MNFEKIKNKIKHDWKYHKSSTYVFWYGTFFMLISIFTGVQAFKAGYSLDGPLLTMIVFINIGVTMWFLFKEMSQGTYEVEEKKEQSLLTQDARSKQE